MNFETRLYELRKKAGLSQEELANLVGVSRQAVQKWEAGTSRPDVDNLTALASYFNVTLDWLILGREPELLQERPVVVENHYHYEGWHYEYKSERTLFGLPLVHINLSQRGLTWARGIVAIGNVATGVVAIGCFAAGILSLGAICLGLLVLAGMAVGLVALGGISIGIIAVGGCALGYLAIGGSAVGGVRRGRRGRRFQGGGGDLGFRGAACGGPGGRRGGDAGTGGFPGDSDPGHGPGGSAGVDTGDFALLFGKIARKRVWKSSSTRVCYVSGEFSSEGSGAGTGGSVGLRRSTSVRSI